MHDLVPVILVMNDEFWLPYALDSIRGNFSRYVIYDVGSKDNTGNIIDWFVEQEKDNAEFYVRSFDDRIEPSIQGIFRNSMIAETQSEFYFILDGDEVYSKTLNWEYIKQESVDKRYLDRKKIYGLFKRKEIKNDLKTCYSELRPHHRIYHRTAIWKGPHPGEEAVLLQKPIREFHLPVLCYHFHNTLRSRLEDETFSRIRRKTKSTYKPGVPITFDLFKSLPQLTKPIHTFKPHPELEKMQNALKV